MIDLGVTEFYIDVPSLPRHEFETYSTKLFDEWEAYAEQVLKVPDYALSLEVEEGSIKGVARIATALCALYIGIGQYGSFVSGIQTIKGQVSSVADFLSVHAVAPFSSSNVKPRFKRNSGSLGKLHRLFAKVQQGKITAEQAMVEAEKIFGDEANSAPDFVDGMRISLEDMPVLAKQLELPLGDFGERFLLPPTMKASETRSRLPNPEVPIGQQFRVEVWRESKKEKRKVRIVNL